MVVQQLIAQLESNPQSPVRFVLPAGNLIPPHFHVTEVGRVEKNFIDCGGTIRQTISCLMQVWTANDYDHRLVSGKLAKILRLAIPILKSEDLPVEVEYGNDVASVYFLSDIQIVGNEVRLLLVGKQTDCLARDKCGVGGCGTSGCCSTEIFPKPTGIELPVV